MRWTTPWLMSVGTQTNIIQSANAIAINVATCSTVWGRICENAIRMGQLRTATVAAY